MTARPPQWTTENADRFKDRTVVDAYHLRSPYPPGIFDELVTLAGGESGAVLDIGTGTGEIARAIAPRVGRVDAVDASAAMIERGKSQPGGDHPNLHWIVSRIEDLVTESGYTLVTAGDSLHWMDWDVVLPRFRELLTPEGFLAIVHRTERPKPWQEELMSLIARYSTSQYYETFDLIAELERRGLYEVTGRHESPPTSFRQAVPDYIESFHSRSSFSRENMPAASADAFDDGLRTLLQPWSADGYVTLETVGEIVWGLPLAKNR